MPRYHPEAEWIMGFEIKHEVGTICGQHCKLCKDAILTDAKSREIPRNPLYLLREATEKEWRESVRSRGGVPFLPMGPAYFYAVTTD